MRKQIKAQNIRHSTIVEYLNYIAFHDEWRCAKREQELAEIKHQPLHTKRKKKALKPAKRAEYRNQVRRVLDLIEQLPSVLR